MSDFLEGSPVNQIDLHIHSDASDDGDWSVERIIDEAHGLGIGTLAITDHNSVMIAGTFEMRCISNRCSSAKCCLRSRHACRGYIAFIDSGNLTI